MIISILALVDLGCDHFWNLNGLIINRNEKDQVRKYDCNYSDRDRTKEKTNHYIQDLKDGDDDVCGAVLDTLSADYLSYITNLVKASKTPPKSKHKTEEHISRLFDEKDNKPAA